jgi:hypothetical protein
MKVYKISLGKLINELKLLERESKNQKRNLRFLIDCLSLNKNLNGGIK